MASDTDLEEKLIDNQIEVGYAKTVYIRLHDQLFIDCTSLQIVSMHLSSFIV